MNVLWLLAYFFVPSISTPSFKIDYENDRFLKDDEPFQYIAGSIHYSRVPQAYWSDRLTKMRAGGLNAIQFYIPWNVHEPFPGKFDFSGINNVGGFIKLAGDLNLMVILRMGPFIAGEWENGGLPWWLLKNKDIKMRTNDKRFIDPVKKWYKVLFPLLVPLLYKNGGPIIMIQIENEYGSFPACDIEYMAFLRDTVRSYVGYDTVIFTDDGGTLSYLKCGFTPDVYPTVDGNYKTGFPAQKVYAPRGPSVNSEYYPGWLGQWGRNFTIVSTDDILTDVTAMYNLNASFDFYMFHGGTNFGFWAGAGYDYPVTTSYDYDAPLSEPGDPTPKYFAIRQLIQSLTNRRLPPVPPASQKEAYGHVTLTKLGTVIDLLDKLSPSYLSIVQSKYPLSMEEMDFPYGFILYETKILDSGFELNGTGIRDRGYVMINGCQVGIIINHFGKFKATSLYLNLKAGDKLQILVENNGRWGGGYNQFKGIISNITLNGRILTDWTIYPILLDNFNENLHPNSGDFLESSNCPAPAIYSGTFSASKLADTFMDPTGWGKGQFYINKNNVGRYYPTMGPQVTLYTPKPFLKELNTVVMFELEETRENQKSITFTNVPNLNKTVIANEKDLHEFTLPNIENITHI